MVLAFLLVKHIFNNPNKFKASLLSVKGKVLNLASSKKCDLCQENIMLNNYSQVQDGTVCVNCTNLFSPWFSDYSKSTVGKIADHLNYREENLSQRFSLDSKISPIRKGELTIIIDNTSKAFKIENPSTDQGKVPDIIKFSQVISCSLEIIKGSVYTRKNTSEDIDEANRILHLQSYEDEDERNYYRRVVDSGKHYVYKNGKRVDNDEYMQGPGRHKTCFDFFITLKVKNDYFNEIRFKVNAGDIYYNEELEYRDYKDHCQYMCSVLSQ